MQNTLTGTQLSGGTYLRAKLRSDSPARKNWFPLIIRQPWNCNCHNRDNTDPATVCTECVTSWSWDHDLAFDRTGGGRALAKKLNLDPLTACVTLRYRDGYEASLLASGN